MPPRTAGRGAAEADAICFASSSAVASYLDQAGRRRRARRGGLHRAGHRRHRPRPRACKVSAEASEHTLDGLADGLVGASGRGPQGEGRAKLA